MLHIKVNYREANKAAFNIIFHVRSRIVEFRLKCGATQGLLNNMP
jgi:hypothetical protein